MAVEKKPREFWTLVFRDAGYPTHIRIPNADGMGIFLIGWAADLHGEHGRCNCCHGRQHPNTKAS